MLRRLLLSIEGGLALDAPEWRFLAQEFPSVRLELGRDSRAPAISADLWTASDLDLLSLDGELFPAVERAGALRLSARAYEARALAEQVLTHFQALLDRRNEGSSTPTFDAVLGRHRALHALDKPLVRADFLHARDVWQWLLRLEPGASVALQLAALFHDIERLRSEPDLRVEHRAPDYQAFKDAHARGGAAMLAPVLEDCGIDRDTIGRAAELVARHERPGKDPELALLNDADALSFFSLNAAGYLNYFSIEQTRKKIDYTLSRLRSEQRYRLRALRLPAQVRALVDACLASTSEATA